MRQENLHIKILYCIVRICCRALRFMCEWPALVLMTMKFNCPKKKTFCVTSFLAKRKKDALIYG